MINRHSPGPTRRLTLVDRPKHLNPATGGDLSSQDIQMFRQVDPSSEILGVRSIRSEPLGADKGYDSADFVAELRQMVVTPHIAQKARHSAIDGRTIRHPGYGVSQRHRKKIEEPFGWAKTVGGMAQTLHRGREKLRAKFTMTMAACNLARLPKLLAA